MRSRFGLRLNRGLRLRPSFALLPGSIVTVGGVAGIRPGDGTGEGKGRSAGGTGNKGTFFFRIFARPPMFRPVWRSREDPITISRARERGRRDRMDAHHPGLFFAIARCSHRRAVSARSGEIPTGYNGKAHTGLARFQNKYSRLGSYRPGSQRGGVRFFSGEGGNGCFCFLCFLEPPRLSASGDRARTGDRTLGGEAPRAFAGDRTFRGEAGFVATGGDLRLGSSIPRYPSSADRSREPGRRMGSPHLSNSTLGSRLFPESLDRRRSLSLLRSLSRLSLIHI